jgi:DNA repair exonuclease SbcCD ATPase subunit
MAVVVFVEKYPPVPCDENSCMKKMTPRQTSARAHSLGRMNPNNHNENIAAGMGGGRVQAMQQQQPHNDPTEALESKLHSAIAQLRQSRNEAHRQQQMAANRVKLVTAGVQAVTDAIQQASAQLSGLQEQMADSEPALDEANAAVQRSTKEASVLRLSQCFNFTKIIVSLLAFFVLSV